MGQQRAPICGPASLLGVGKVDDQDGTPLGDSIQARPLAEGELQFVVGAGGMTARSQCSAARAIEDERDCGCIDVEKDHTGLAETVGGPYPAATLDSRQKLLMDCHI